MGTGIEHRRAARHTLDRPGFGVTRGGHEVLIGVPEITGPADERVSARQVGAVIAATGVSKVEALVRLPERIALRQIINAFASSDAGADPLNLPFAIGESALAPVALPTHSAEPGGDRAPAVRKDHHAGGPRPDDHGPLPPEQAQITIIDPKTTLIGKVRGPHVRAYAYTVEDIDAAIGALAGSCSSGCRRRA